MSLDRSADSLGRSTDVLAAFFAGLGAAPSRVLILDYDGTLAPLVEDRHRAAPYEWVPDRLERVRRADTRVVIVSGRPVDELARLLSLDPPPELWGAHGWERRVPGEATRRQAVPEQEGKHLRAVARAAESLVSAERVERKVASVAVHVRGLPPEERRRVLERVRSAWEGLGGGQALRVDSFDGGIEARAAGRDKGSAVLDVVGEEPADAAIAYLGDDVTDEDAFRALEGRGLTVLVRAEPRPTLASARLAPPGDVRRFLDAWIRACSLGHGGGSMAQPLRLLGSPT